MNTNTNACTFMHKLNLTRMRTHTDTQTYILKEAMVRLTCTFHLSQNPACCEQV